MTILLSVITIIWAMSFSRKRIFCNEIQDIKFYYFILISFSVIIFIVNYYIINWIKKIIDGDQFSRKLVKHFSIYLGIMLIVLLLIWPGYWVWDEIWVIDALENGFTYTWQSVLTQLLYAYSLLIMPVPVSITIMQTIVISLILAFVNTKIEEKFENKWCNIIVYILFLLPSLLINNLYALRLQLYGYLMLLLVTNLIFDYWDKKEISKSKIILMQLLSIPIIVWRSEGIIFFILIPILMAITYKNLRKIYIIAIMIIINILAYVGYGKAFPSDSKYQTIIFMNPLSIMLQEELKGENIQQDLENIDKVMDIKLIKENPSYVETPAYWNYQSTIFREDYKEHMGKFYKAYLDIIINNPLEFLQARMKTFLASNGMDKEYREIGAITKYFKEEKENQAIDQFLEKYPIMNPLNRELKVNVETMLLGSESWANSLIRPAFWNVIPILLGMFIVMIERVIRKDWCISLIYLSLFAKTAIVILTAPASYFMYFLPEYICGSVIIALSIYKIIEEKIKV